MEEKELFSLELNGEGLSWLKRLQSVAMFILIATFFYNAMNLYNTLPYVFDANNSSNIPGSWKLNNTIFIFYLIIHAILQVVHAFFYYEFSILSRQAIDDQNSIHLNQSFRFLFWQAVTFLIQVCFSLAYFLFSFLIKKLN